MQCPRCPTARLAYEICNLFHLSEPRFLGLRKSFWPFAWLWGLKGTMRDVVGQCLCSLNWPLLWAVLYDLRRRASRRENKIVASIWYQNDRRDECTLWSQRCWYVFELECGQIFSKWLCLFLEPSLCYYYYLKHFFCVGLVCSQRTRERRRVRRHSPVVSSAFSFGGFEHTHTYAFTHLACCFFKPPDLVLKPCNWPGGFQLS